MLVWIGFAVMTALVTAALLRPMWRGRTRSVAAAEADLAVYRDQLNEIASDEERGLLAPTEAESAKTEVARRILARAGAAELEAPADPAVEITPRARGMATFAAAFVPLASIALYLWVGSPSMPDAPLSARLEVPVEQATVEELIGRVEARLAATPDDVKGWHVIAPIYARTGRFADAANAYRRILALEGESVPGLISYAEAVVAANNGLVGDPARKAFSRILELEPDRVEAVFGLALAKEQDGDAPAALADYRKLLAGAPADADWKAALDKRIAEVEARSGAAPAPAAAAAGTERAEPPDLAKMDAAERERFIGAMVERLADRLKTQPNDLQGWQRLIRAYAVLGRDDAVTTALADARRALAADSEALGAIDTLEKSVKQTP